MFGKVLDVDIDELTQPARLGAALARVTGDARWAHCTARHIAGGRSNLTFEVTSAAGAAIMRRPPSGELLPSAHNMGREVRVQRALAGSNVPVPEIILFDTDGDLVGVPCYVMAKVEGHVIRETVPPGYAETSDDRRGIADVLVDTLVELHAIDPVDVGLGDFGRPDGFLERQLRRWNEQWERSATHDVPEVVGLGQLLAAALPKSQRSSIVHGDYRLDNCVMDDRDPQRIAAVLDWELSSLGDPLTDLGMLLFYWREPHEPQLSIAPTVTSQPGFPPRKYLAERYAQAAGVTLDDIEYYVAFAHFKFAVIVQGVAARVASGSMAGQDFGSLDATVRDTARSGLRILEQRG
ncbi:phosphotransferase family protein [soil metagenome]